MSEDTTLRDQESHRREKLERLRAMGVDPWGARFADHQPIAEIRDLFQEDQDPGPIVRAAGRVMLRRDMGKVVFMDVRDRTGKIQLYLGKKQVGEQTFEVVRLTDLGDLVGVEGTLRKTRTGELTIFATQFVLLAKSLAVPPEKWHGLQDVELRCRQRYLDLTYNPEVAETFEARSRIVASMRTTLNGRGFLEVETPMMQPIAGGAAARPFITHHNTLHMDLYLRIAPELYLKRLLVGGMERVFEIGRVFRNEGIDRSHNPEYTLLEAYQAYGDYNDMMDLAEALVTGSLEAIGKGPKVPYGDVELDFTTPWARRTYADLVREHAGVDTSDATAARALAGRLGLEPEGKHDDVVIEDLFDECVQPQLVQPTFVIDYPASLCPLTKRKRDNDRVAERFELFAVGMELGNAYTELNDPVLQEDLFRTQLAGQEETMATMDEDFVRALCHGMPPAGGIGIGVGRLVMLLTNSPSLRDVILFPLMRPAGTPADADGGKDACPPE